MELLFTRIYTIYIVSSEERRVDSEQGMGNGEWGMGNFLELPKFGF